MKIGIAGSAGRMGQMLVKEVLNTQHCQLAGGSEMPGHKAIGHDIGEIIGAGRLGLALTPDPHALFNCADVVIDFTSPKATLENARIAAQMGKALVVGTTGLSEADKAVLKELAEKAVIVQSSNMSLGVNLLAVLVEKVAHILDISYDIEIVEMHHRHKVDAPSGTALLLGEAAAHGRNVELAQVAQRVRDGHTGARKMGDIGFATLRGGDVVGDHNVIFATDGERLELGHKASSRQVFAKGAVKAAIWTHHQKPGLYSMRDVLGI